MPAVSVNQLARRLTRTTELPDADLLDRFRTAGDAAAFEAIVQRHGGLVLAACRRILADEADVEDAFQATFLVLLRNARAVRHEASVGGWLFGVARRVALKARSAAVVRQDREAKTSCEAATLPADLSWQEACDALHAELDRLPAKYHQPIWLCYFEGKTRDDVAAALGCSAGAVKGYLERGRELLRRRLAKRGIALPAGLLFGALANPVTATVSPHLVRLAVRAAATPSPAVAALTRGMIGAKVRWSLVVTAVVAAVGIAFAVMPDSTAAHAPQPPARGDDPRPPDPRPKSSARAITGTVTGPDGKPVAGATVYIAPPAPRAKHSAHTRTGEDGKYHLTFDPDAITGSPAADEPWKDAQVVAAKKEFGIDWARVGDLKGAEWNAKLVADQPITGTILDLEGRPVVGATVAVSHLQDWTHPGQMDEYLAALPAGKARYVNTRYWWGFTTDLRSGERTDAKGQFTFYGLGKNRLVTLVVGGAGVAWTRVVVLNRPGVKVEGKDNPGRTSPPLVLYPSTFELPLPPGRTLVFRVVDYAADPVAGKPVAGMEVTVPHQPPAWTGPDGTVEFNDVGTRDLVPTTVKSGPTSATYLGMAINQRGKPGLGKQTVERQVSKGIPIRAKVVERGSDHPVEADVAYVPLYPSDQVPDWLEDLRTKMHRQPDGTYLGAALPGPGAVVVRRTPKRYAPAVADQKAFFKLDQLPTGRFGGSGNDLWMAAHSGLDPMPLPVRQYQAVRFINPAKNAAEVSVTLELDPGVAKRIRFADADGPLTGVRFRETVEERWSDEVAEAERTVTGIGRGQTRTQFLRRHDGRKLGAVVELKEDTPSPHTAVLKPWATVTGRLGGGDARLFADMVLYGLPEYATTDKDGRFRIERLPPDHPFDVWVGRGGLILGRFPQPLSAKPGEEKDLGEVRLTPAK